MNDSVTAGQIGEEILKPDGRKKVNTQRLLALLAENCLSQSKISKRLGVSRERVRQLANRLMHQTGTERKQICKFNLESAKLADHPFVAKARELACKRTVGHAEYVSLKRPMLSEDPDFFVFSLPGGGWMIFPAAKAPVSETSFALNFRTPRNRGSYSIGRHDWRDYIDAWHLLKGEAHEERKVEETTRDGQP